MLITHLLHDLHNDLHDYAPLERTRQASQLITLSHCDPLEELRSHQIYTFHKYKLNVPVVGTFLAPLIQLWKTAVANGSILPCGLSDQKGKRQLQLRLDSFGITKKRPRHQ